MIKSFWRKFFQRKNQPHKIDIYSGIAGEKQHSHETLSGAEIIGGKMVGGETYYKRDRFGKVLINKDEAGNNLR